MEGRGFAYDAFPALLRRRERTGRHCTNDTTPEAGPARANTPALPGGRTVPCGPCMANLAFPPCASHGQAGVGRMPWAVVSRRVHGPGRPRLGHSSSIFPHLEIVREIMSFRPGSTKGPSTTHGARRRQHRAHGVAVFHRGVAPTESSRDTLKEWCTITITPGSSGRP